MTNLQARHPLEQELDDKIPTQFPEYRAIYLRLALELISQGYSAITAVSFLKEIRDAVLGDCECQ